MSHPNYLAAARNARTAQSRRRFTRLYREQKIRDAIINCDVCDLHTTCAAPVPWNGPTSSSLVIVGEGPGRNEDEQGEPFVGASGRLLDRSLEKVGTARENVMVLNAVCCRPPNNRTPEKVEVEACRVNLDAQLKLAKATVGVLLGKSAYEAVIGKLTGRFGDVEGVAVWAHGRIWIPAFHPAYLIRNHALKYKLERVLTLALLIANGDLGWPKIDPATLDFAEEPGAALRKRLDSQGWAKMWSGKLQDVIVVARDENVGMPQKIRRLPRYTMVELVKIGLAGEMRNRMRGEDLAAIHLVKTELGGKVML